MSTDEICEHVASGQAEPFVTLEHKDTGSKRAFCQPCLISFIRGEGDDPAQFVIGYNFYQSTDSHLPKDQWKKLNDKPLPSPEFSQDRSDLEAGATYSSYVTAVSAYGIEGLPSEVFSLTIPAEEWPDRIGD